MKTNTILIILLIIFFVSFAISLLIIGNLYYDVEYYKTQFKTTCELSNLYVDEINILIKWSGMDELENATKIPCDKYLFEK